jgi:hypothetical protein
VLVDRDETLRSFFTVGIFVASDGHSLVAQDCDAFGLQSRCEAFPVNVRERRWKK